MEKAYFNNIRSEIIPFLKQAKEKVCIAMAWFTSNELFEELLDCLSRNIQVELILLDNPTNFMEYAPDFNRFIEKGGSFRLASSECGFMHHKFCIVDDKAIITGSYNWTYYAENRNIENIVISDEPSVIQEYKEEFSRLTQLISLQKEAPRLSWSDIEQRDDVDYREINAEIEYICDTKNLPIHREIKPTTTVQIIETKKTPRAKYSIGIEVDENGERDFATFIKKGQEIPYKSESVTFYMDSVNEKEFPCRLIYGSPNNRDTWKLIKEESLMPVAQNVSNENLIVQFSIHLDVNGSLRTEVVCPESGRTMMITALNNDFVKYE